MAIKLFISGLVFIIGAIYFTKEFLKAENVIFEIESLPLVETDEAVDGVPIAVEGIIEPEEGKILRSPYTNTECVYFHSIKEIYVRRKNTGYWKIVENIALFVPFYIKDQRGKIKVDLINLDDDFSSYQIPLRARGVPDPKNSEIDCEPILKKQSWSPEGETKKRFFSKSSEYRVSEYVLRPGTKVFACGMISKKNGQFVLHESDRCPLIITRKNRDQYVQEFYRGGNLVYLSHFLVAIGFTVSILAINYFLKIHPFKLFVSLALGNLIILGSAIFSIYNRIVTLKNRALNALSNIDVELKRRADLISNIIEVVRGFVKHEQEVQKIIAESRTKMVFAKEMQKEEKPILNSLVAVIEQYPNLKSAEQFQNLMKILVDTEERIAYSREFYNRTVRKYNT
ncbi:LemA family protein, partial [Candidatus Parcubacteria bacterium]|nr:LemA family protein [Candidatus Parcubacteria bacterium]